MPEIRKQDVDKLQSLHRFLGEVLGRLSAQEVVLSPEVAARVAARQKAGQCLLCGEKIVGRQTRGADISCYNKTVNRINRGEITEAEVVEKGWLLAENARAGRKSAKPDPMVAFISDKPATSAEHEGKATAQDLAAEENLAAEKKSGKKATRKKRG